MPLTRVYVGLALVLVTASFASGPTWPGAFVVCALAVVAAFFLGGDSDE